MNLSAKRGLRRYILHLKYTFILVFILNSVCLAGTLHGYISNQLGMVGIRVSRSDKTISKVYKDSPAAIAGLKVKDLILKVDGKKGWTDGIDGEPYTPVRIEIKREGKILEFEIFRLEKELINFGT